MPFAHAHTCNHPHLDPQTPSKSLPKAIAETGQALHDSYVRTFVARDHMRRLNRPTPWPPRSLTPRPSIPAVQWLGRRVPHPPALTYGAAALALTRERHADADSEPHSESCRPCRPKFATPQVIQSRHSTAMSAAARPKCVVNQGLVTPLGVVPVHVYVSLVAWPASKLYVMLQVAQHGTNYRSTEFGLFQEYTTCRHCPLRWTWDSRPKANFAAMSRRGRCS